MTIGSFVTRLRSPTQVNMTDKQIPSSNHNSEVELKVRKDVTINPRMTTSTAIDIGKSKVAWTPSKSRFTGKSKSINIGRDVVRTGSDLTHAGVMMDQTRHSLTFSACDIMYPMWGNPMKMLTFRDTELEYDFETYVIRKLPYSMCMSGCVILVQVVTFLIMMDIYYLADSGFESYRIIQQFSVKNTREFKKNIYQTQFPNDWKMSFQIWYTVWRCVSFVLALFFSFVGLVYRKKRFIGMHLETFACLTLLALSCTETLEEMITLSNFSNDNIYPWGWYYPCQKVKVTNTIETFVPSMREIEVAFMMRTRQAWNGAGYIILLGVLPIRLSRSWWVQMTLIISQLLEILLAGTMFPVPSVMVPSSFIGLPDDSYNSLSAIYGKSDYQYLLLLPWVGLSLMVVCTRAFDEQRDRLLFHSWHKEHKHRHILERWLNTPSSITGDEPQMTTGYEEIVSTLLKAEGIANTSSSLGGLTKVCMASILTFLRECRELLLNSKNIFSVDVIQNEFARKFLDSIGSDSRHTEHPDSFTPSVGDINPSNMMFLMSNLCFAEQLGVDWNLKMFQLSSQVEGPLQHVGYVLLCHYANLPGMWHSQNKLHNFLRDIENAYLDNPYHNSLHAAQVAHYCGCFVNMMNLNSVISPTDFVTLCIAALCHDVGHFGFNNIFVINIKHPLSLVYNDISPLQNMHASKTFQIMLENQGQNNILSNASDETYADIRKQIIDLILATDKQFHFDSISLFRTHRNHENFNPRSSISDLRFLIKMFLTASDIGHCSALWSVHYEWSLRMAREYLLQGQQEAAHGLQISPLCDRKSCGELPSNVSLYVQLVAMPLFMELEAVDDAIADGSIGKICIYNMNQNLREWKNLKGTFTFSFDEQKPKGLLIKNYGTSSYAQSSEILHGQQSE